MTTNIEAARAFYFAGLVAGVDYDHDAEIYRDEYNEMLIEAWDNGTLPAELIDDARRALYRSDWEKHYGTRAAEFLADPTCSACNGLGWANVNYDGQLDEYGDYESFCECVQ